MDQTTAMGLCRSISNPDADVSVQLEESLMQALRQIEATIDSVVSILSNSIPGFVTANGSTSDPQVGTRHNSVPKMFCFQLKHAQLGTSVDRLDCCSVMLKQTKPQTWYKRCTSL